LEGKVAIVTGAARGQGEAEARLFVAEGARVLLTDVLAEPGAKLAAELGPNAHFARQDVSSEAGWEETIALAQSRFGGLDVLVNNAGIVHYASLFDHSADDFLRIVRVNQLGVFLGIKHAGAVMSKRGGGSIVNISSIGGLVGVGGAIAYTASKHAVTGMTKVAALELGRLGVRVNSIHPGGVDTAMVEMPDAARPAARAKGGMPHVPLARIGTPEEIARAALFLASDESSYCTGTALLVDGGLIAGVNARSF
jgi:3alpha(or 20beta)-hydroxysteroid dehydrogenase